jgi:hypothetical protein
VKKIVTSLSIATPVDAIMKGGKAQSKVPLVAMIVILLLSAIVFFSDVFVI